MARGRGAAAAVGAAPAAVGRSPRPRTLRPPRNVFAIGRNYRSHAAELAGTVFRDVVAQEDPWPIVFTKLPDCVVGPHDDVRLPGASVSVQIDYESELGRWSSGRGGRDIPARAAWTTCSAGRWSTTSARATCRCGHKQWELGKSFDTFCPMGPVDHHRPTSSTPRHARARLGQRRAAPGRPHARPDLRHPGADRDLLARHHAACPGDVIATGTPAGVGMGFDPPKWLRHGDVVRIEIDGIGAIENRFATIEDGAWRSSGSTRIAVETEGDGDAVVCVHGPGRHHQHLHAADGGDGALSRRAHRPAGQRPLARGVPGRSRSSAGRARADGVRAAGHRARALVGHSMGTIVCQHVAVAQPQLVRSLALFGR
jgi:2-keto-4-pentenoate hydratase/2-oxohepta-3-ene-1,7-dioic acid hydratase in catechol pathway